jgi:hypothetical protein
VAIVGGQKGGLLGFVRRRWLSWPPSPRRDGRKSTNRRAKTDIPKETSHSRDLEVDVPYLASQKRGSRFEVSKLKSKNRHLRIDVPLLTSQKLHFQNRRLKSDVPASSRVPYPNRRAKIQVSNHVPFSCSQGPFAEQRQ